jgi:nicotinamidase-related amidase
MISKEHSVALMIDMQERLLPVMHESDILVNNTIKLLKGLAELKIEVVVSQQYTKGLGDTIESIKAEIPNFSYSDKKIFSAADEPEIESHLAQHAKNYVIVFGVETHVCVSQTCLSLLAQGYQPVLVTDCTASRKPKDVETAMQRLLNAGVILTTYEALLFELLETAEASEFKAISSIIK